jgi:hypothetical protein
MDLKINVGKTKVMVIGSEDVDEANELFLDGEKLEQAKKFVYLGRLFQENGNIDGEIDRRVSAGRKVVKSMTGLAKSGGVVYQGKTCCVQLCFSANIDVWIRVLGMSRTA